MEALKSFIREQTASWGRFLEVDLFYFLKGGTYLLGSDIVSALISLGTAVAFANLFPKETYGSFQYILSVIAVLDIFNLPGLDSALTYGIARGQEGTFIEGIKAKLRIGTIGSILIVVWAGYNLYKGNTMVGLGLIVAALFMTAVDAAGTYGAYLQGKKRFDLASIYDPISQVFSTIMLVLTLLVSKNLIIIVAVYFITRLLSRIYFLRRTLRILPPNTAVDPSVIKYGYHLTIMQIGTAISGNIDRLLLWHFLGPVQVAIYTFAITIPLRLVGFLRNINRMAFPKMAASKELRRGQLLKSIGLLMIFTSLCAIAYAIAAPFIFKIFFSKYHEAIVFSQAAAIFIALQPISLLATSLTAQGKKKALYIYNIIIPATQSILLALCIPLLHIKGAIIALTLTKIIEGCLLFFLSFDKAPAEPAPETLVPAK